MARRKTTPPLRPFADRFWEKVNKHGPIPVACPQLGPCWEWTASLDANGYGRLRKGRRTETLTRAHHYPYELLNGPIPDELEPHHLCFNRKCVNPSHIKPMTHAENVRLSGGWSIAQAVSAAKKRNRTHCIHSHEFTPENMRINRDGSRKCLACARNYRRAHYLRTGC